MQRGIFFGVGAFVLWGILPIYWKTLSHITSLEILGHRILWSFFLLLVVQKIRQKESWLQKLRKNPKHSLIYLGSSLLIGTNWYIYIWAVNSGYIVEASLGYFINPLVNVLLGVVFLNESLRKIQWFAISIAAFGVLWITFQYGSFPWIALALAFSFGFYGLIRKVGPLNSLNGLASETAFLLLPVMGYLLYLELQNSASFIHAGTTTSLLLVGSGLATAIPLLLFAKAIRLLPLSTMGILQYLAPTLQLMVGVMIYSEDFDQNRMQGFLIIWVALLLYSGDALSNHRAKQKRKKSDSWCRIEKNSSRQDPTKEGDHTESNSGYDRGDPLEY